MDKVGAARASSAVVTRSMLDADVMLVEYRGVVSAADWLKFGRSGISPRAPEALGVIVRCDKAVMALSETEAAASAEAFAPLLSRHVPGAIVVHEDQLATFKAYAWALARFGILRRIVTDPLVAYSWTREQVNVELEHQAECRLASPPKLRSS